MLQRQFISRIIQEMSDMPNRLKKLSEEEKWEEVEKLTASFYKTYLKADGREGRDFSVPELLARFNQDAKAFDPLSAVFALEAERLTKQGRTEEARKSGKQALTLLEYLDTQEAITFSRDRKNRITLLKKQYE
ncbi:MAG TPA: hypothetical protein VGO45_07180 [Bacteroidia bacterium]|jgi:hypothetical protein|nr:hypothetical protein [Bacteroidia bacterium]